MARNRQYLPLVFILLVHAFINHKASAQEPCGFNAIREKMFREDPVFRNRQEAFEKLWQQVHHPGNVAQKVVINGTDTLYEIPVVVHVIHTGGAVGSNYNPSDATIQGTITALNQNFAATFPGHPAAGAGGVNIPVRFALAQRDPFCNPTNGINRINGVTALGGTNGTTYANSGVRSQTANGITDAMLKGIIQWPPGAYYNIWVVSEIDNWDGYVAGSGVAGYATLPGGAANLDGMVVIASELAPSATTIPHEMGHAFNLLHPFNGGCVTGNCAATGDNVCDTDPQSATVFNCPTGSNPCTGTSWVPLINNIMGYASCTDRFTQGQSNRMMQALFNMRGSLIQSLGATAPGTEPVQPSPAVAACAGPGIANVNNTFDVGPRNVTIGDLQSFSQGYTRDGNLSYVNRTQASCLQAAVAPAHLQKGQTYNISVGAGNNPEDVRVYIDYNNDGSFTGTGELVFSNNGPSGQSFYTHTGSFTVPNQPYVVENAYVRIRVVSDLSSTNPQPCATLQYGQAEDFAVIFNQVVLPVTLKDFTAKVMSGNRAIHLAWGVSEEAEFSHYEIQKSGDGQSFSKIGTVQAKGSGSSYGFDDFNPSPNTNYYRLKMVDLDGRYEFSPVRTAILSGNNATLAFTLYPNPANGWIEALAPESGSFTYRILNMAGQQIMRGSKPDLLQGDNIRIDLSSTAPGIYYLHFVNKTGTQFRAKFIRQ